MVKVDVTSETVIERPLAQVAEYAADPSNAPAWYRNIASVEWETEPPRLHGRHHRSAPEGRRSEVHLVHCGLSGPMVDAHNGGWANYLARLTAVATGRDPGPDPLADERVPAADPETLFWACAALLLAAAGVTRSTMMGFACLRPEGEFFASFDHRDRALVVKLDEQRVDHLLASGHARPFAPNGRRFKARATIPADAVERWDDVLRDALAAVVHRRDHDRPP